MKIGSPRVLRKATRRQSNARSKFPQKRQYDRADTGLAISILGLLVAPNPEAVNVYAIQAFRITRDCQEQTL
jgi:hypothetical protein